MGSREYLGAGLYHSPLCLRVIKKKKKKCSKFRENHARFWENQGRDHLEPLGLLDVQGAGLLRAAALFLPPVHLPLLRLQRGVLGFAGEGGGGERSRKSGQRERCVCAGEGEGEGEGHSERENESERGR